MSISDDPQRSAQNDLDEDASTVEEASAPTPAAEPPDGPRVEIQDRVASTVDATAANQPSDLSAPGVPALRADATLADAPPAIATVAGAPRQFARRSPLMMGSVVAALVVVVFAGVFGWSSLQNSGLGPFARASTPAPTPIPTATPAQKVLLQDPLIAKSTMWPQQTECAFRADGYHVSTNIICYANLDGVENGYLSVTVKELSGSADLSYGVTFRRPSKGDYYSFEIDGSGHWYVYRSTDSILTALVNPTTNAAIKKGLNQENQLQIRAIGSHFEFFANGVKLGAVDDTTYSKGRFGLGANDQIEVVYTALLLTRPL